MDFKVILIKTQTIAEDWQSNAGSSSFYRRIGRMIMYFKSFYKITKINVIIDQLKCDFLFNISDLNDLILSGLFYNKFGDPNKEVVLLNFIPVLFNDLTFYILLIISVGFGRNIICSYFYFILVKYRLKSSECISF